jgi:hypothetical protein
VFDNNVVWVFGYLRQGYNVECATTVKTCSYRNRGYLKSPLSACVIRDGDMGKGMKKGGNAKKRGKELREIKRVI